MTIRPLLVASLLLASAVASPAAAQEEIVLWPGGAPGSEGKTGPEVDVQGTTNDGIRRVAGIHKPSIAAHLPAKGTATGAAVIVLPGGGHRYLSIDNEGHAVAKWLAEHGIAAFVLKYRLAREEGSTYKVEEHPVADTHRAIRVIRSRAKSWGIDPARVGLIGFSAGGQVTAYAAARFDAGKVDASDPIERESSRPAFQALVYSGSISAETVVPANAPPAFILVAFDDKGPAGTAIDLFQKLRAAGVVAELHIYAKGGHGFGMRNRPLPITSWTARFQEWLGDQGFLAVKAVTSP